MNSQHGNGSQHSGDIGSSVKSLGDSSAALTNEFRNFVADIEDLIKSTASLSGEELSQAKERIRERIASAKDRLGDTGETVVARARRTIAATNDYVNDEPWKAIGLGTVLGFLIGVLVARR